MSGAWVAAFVALSAAVGLTVVVLLGFLRRAAAVLEEAEARLAAFTTHATAGGRPPGTPIDTFLVHDELGEPRVSSELLESGAVFLFMESGCKPCGSLAESLSASNGELGGVPLYVILDDSEEGHRFPKPRAAAVLYQRARAASRAFSSVTTPQAFAVDTDGVIVDLVIPASAEAIHKLSERVIEHGGGAGVARSKLRPEASVS